jgi:hypothetical protein
MKKQIFKLTSLLLIYNSILNLEVFAQNKKMYFFEIDSSSKINENLIISFELDSHCVEKVDFVKNKFYFEDSTHTYLISIFNKEFFIEEYFYEIKNKKKLFAMTGQKLFKEFVEKAINLYDTSDLKPIVYVNYQEQIFYSVHSYNDTIIYSSPAIKISLDSKFLSTVLIRKKHAPIGDILKSNQTIDILKSVTIKRKED